MRRPLWLAAGIAAAYAVFLVATVPAAFLAPQLSARTAGLVAMTDAHGTLWHGDGRITVTPTGAAGLTLERVSWRFLPSRLISGRVAYEVTIASAGLAARGEIGRSLSTYSVEGLDLRGDAAPLERASPLLAPWHPTGKIALSTPAFEWSDRGWRGEARLDWREASVSLSDVRPVGSYRAELHAEGTAARLAVTTLDGPLRIAGQGSIEGRSRFAFGGEARADASEAKALEPLLDLLGPRRPDGARTLDWRLAPPR